MLASDHSTARLSSVRDRSQRRLSRGVCGEWRGLRTCHSRGVLRASRTPRMPFLPRAHLPPSTQTLPANVLMGLRRAASITTHLSLSNRPDWQALVTTDICSCLLICRFMVIAMNNKTQNYLR